MCDRRKRRGSGPRRVIEGLETKARMGVGIPDGCCVRTPMRNSDSL
jgi:hypothetical protein